MRGQGDWEMEGNEVEKERGIVAREMCNEG